MELYTRMIDEGIFVFWEDQDDHQYELSAYIQNKDKKIRLIHTKIEQGRNCYSLTHLGSGNYEVELNVYRDNRLVETVSKKAVLASTSQRATELLDKLEAIANRIDAVGYTISSIDISSLDDLYKSLVYPQERLYPANWAHFLTDVEDIQSELRRERYNP